MARAGRTSAVQLIDVDPGDSSLLSAVSVLGDLNRRTLGFMPTAAFRHAAESGTLLAAVQTGQLAGYALYALPRQVVRLTHLCVSDNARGNGIARLLVEEISRRYSGRYAIVLKCRKDYPVNTIWPVLGFELQGEIPGRSRDRRPLCIWRRDHGHPDLFSAAESLGLLKVALDVNVFLDLETAGREGAAESRALTDDWLADQVSMVVTNELLHELTRVPSEPQRSQWQSAARRYEKLATDAGAVAAVAERLIDHVARTQHLDLSADLGDISDVRHVAEAYLAGVTVLATRDDRFIRWALAAVEVSGVQVMRPADVVLHVDELARAQAYQPVELQRTEYRLTPVRSRSEPQLSAFLNISAGERKSEYLARIRTLLADRRTWDHTLMRDPQGECIAFYVTGNRDGRLEVPVLRINAKRLEETVSRQILFLIRDRARREGQSVIKITDPALSGASQSAVRDAGFLKHNESWIGFVISACADSATIDALAAQAAKTVDLRMPALRPHLSPVVAAELERTLWPAKITDSDLRTYVLPIRPAWSAELFGVPETLMPRPNRLGISREHVYYRSARPRVVEAPARLLWYVSGSSSPDGMAAIIGCSRLEEVVCDKPAVLYQAFRHLGVWRREHIDRAAHGSRALALRFADTELFPRYVSLRRLRRLAAENRQGLSLRSPQKITSELFAAIYQEGHPTRDQ